MDIVKVQYIAPENMTDVYYIHSLRQMRCHCWSQSNSIWSSNEVVNRFLRLTCSYCPRIDFFFGNRLRLV